jgi:hypothetical protein
LWTNVEEPEVLRQEEKRIGKGLRREEASGEFWGVIVPMAFWKKVLGVSLRIGGRREIWLVMRNPISLVQI